VKRILIGLFVAASLVAAGAQAQAPGTLGKIKAAKAINVAFSGDSLPFSFVGPGNQPAGYSIDICKRVIDQIGRAVGEPGLKVNWLVGTTPERLAMVASGKADIECANTTQTLARLANVDFSGLVFVDGGGFLVKSDSPINKTGDMGGKKIAVLAGTTTEQRLRDTLARRNVAGTVVPIGWKPAASTRTRATRSSWWGLPRRRRNRRSSRCSPRTCRSSRMRSRFRATTPRCGSRSTAR